jgi:hypothetical protein
MKAHRLPTFERAFLYYWQPQDFGSKREKRMSEDTSKEGSSAHLQLLRKSIQMVYPITISAEKPSLRDIQQGQQVGGFLPSADLGEVKDFIIDVGGVIQAIRQVLDDFHQRTPMEHRQRELFPLFWH